MSIQPHTPSFPRKRESSVVDVGPDALGAEARGLDNEATAALAARAADWVFPDQALAIERHANIANSADVAASDPVRVTCRLDICGATKLPNPRRAGFSGPAARTWRAPRRAGIRTSGTRAGSSAAFAECSSGQGSAFVDTLSRTPAGRVRRARGWSCRADGATRPSLRKSVRRPGARSPRSETRLRPSRA